MNTTVNSTFRLLPWKSEIRHSLLPFFLSLPTELSTRSFLADTLRTKSPIRLSDVPARWCAKNVRSCDISFSELPSHCPEDRFSFHWNKISSNLCVSSSKRNFCQKYREVLSAVKLISKRREREVSLKRTISNRSLLESVQDDHQWPKIRFFSLPQSIKLFAASTGRCVLHFSSVNWSSQSAGLC